MSSLRNAVKRITHKERSQLQSRKHLGILEKKKDYKERSTDYHRKQDRVKAMKQKAAMRNPDEFYFGMNKSGVQDGKHRREEDETENQLDEQMVRLLKDQDLAYVRMQKQSDQKKADKLSASLHLLDESAKSSKTKGKHTIFVGSQEDADNFDLAKHFDTVPKLARRAFNRPRLSTLREEAMKKAAGAAKSRESDDDDETEGKKIKVSAKDLEEAQWAEKKARKKAARQREAAYREMEARRERAKKMEIAAAFLETEKNLSGKGRKRKIKSADGNNPAQYKWRRRRLG